LITYFSEKMEEGRERKVGRTPTGKEISVANSNREHTDWIKLCRDGMFLKADDFGLEQRDIDPSYGF
jgi:hypothetical protein